MKPSFDLEAAIFDWRSAAKARHIPNNSLEELEGHLREAFDHQSQPDLDLATAWHQVTTGLGSPKELAREYARNGELNLWDRFALGLLTIGSLAAIISPLLTYRSGPILDSVVFTLHIIVMGLAFLATMLGTLAGLYVLTRRDFTKRLNPRLEKVVRRFVIGFLTVIFLGNLGGVVLLGMIFQNIAFPEFWLDFRILGSLAMVLCSGYCLVSLIKNSSHLPEGAAFRFALFCGAIACVFRIGNAIQILHLINGSNASVSLLFYNQIILFGSLLAVLMLQWWRHRDQNRFTPST